MIPFKDDIRLARTPVITIAVVVANVVAYGLAAAHGGSLIGGPSGQTIVRYGAIPYELGHWGQHCALGLAGFGQAVLCTGQHGVVGHAARQPATWETAFTAMFLHANVLHLAVNMIFLGVFGASVEDRVGRLAFLGFYLLGGLVALVLRFGVCAAAREVAHVLHAGSPATVGVAEPRAARQAAASVGERVPRPDRLQVASAA
jgi:membrane associated rhomboid family serine protease